MWELAQTTATPSTGAWRAPPGLTSQQRTGTQAGGLQAIVPEQIVIQGATAEPSGEGTPESARPGQGISGEDSRIAGRQRPWPSLDL